MSIVFEHYKKLEILRKSVDKGKLCNYPQYCIPLINSYRLASWLSL
jgi:hypothetical protein